ncbi:MAG: multicopper oxidase domain-containing protein [Burkholderiales bacterium]|nr:multicopper oxidase domain-containing protein [Burkholderiales bacterium]
MSDRPREEVTRRDFLRMGVSVAAGVIVTPALTACGGGGGESDGPTETYVQPLEIASVNGVLDVTLVLSYLNTTLPNAQGQMQAVSLRNMFGTIPAPTLRIRVGDLLRIKVFNNLPPNPTFPPSVPPQPPHLKYPNSTNLHTHGLHVFPGIVRPSSPSDPLGLYGDYVVDDPDEGIQPGQTRQYEYRIREDHMAGTFWYHPHLHGSTAIHVGSGMAGMLIIEGPIDDVPEIAAAREMVFVLQAPIFDATGKLESFTNVASVTANNEAPWLVNGVRRPRIVMKTGEVQNWRLLNASIFNMLNVSLDRHTLFQYSHDGNPRHTFLQVAPLPTPAPKPPQPSYPEAVVLGAGNRATLLVKAGAPGTYLLRTMPIEIGRNVTADPSAGGAVGNEDVLAEIVVVDTPFPMSLPPEPLPVTPFLTPITDEELAAGGGLKRTIVLRVNPFNSPLIDPPTGEAPDWVYDVDKTQVAGKVYAIGSVGNTSSTSPGFPPTTYIPFQSSKAITQMVALDAVEEWTIVNMNNIRHPFHIHVNPCWVVAVNGKYLPESQRYWADTLPLPFSNVPPPSQGPGVAMSSITFRSRFIHFTGPYVMHCHMLVHEDMGMMQGVTVV